MDKYFEEMRKLIGHEIDLCFKQSEAMKVKIDAYYSALKVIEGVEACYRDDAKRRGGKNDG